MSRLLARKDHAADSEGVIHEFLNRAATADDEISPMETFADEVAPQSSADVDQCLVGNQRHGPTVARETGESAESGVVAIAHDAAMRLHHGRPHGTRCRLRLPGDPDLLEADVWHQGRLLFEHFGRTSAEFCQLGHDGLVTIRVPVAVFVEVVLVFVFGGKKYREGLHLGHDGFFQRGFVFLDQI